MNHATVNRILDIQDQVRADQALIGEYEVAHAAFLKMLPELSKSQQDTLLDYMGVCIEIHLRMLELSCEPEK